jgi:hypothetical protein
MSTPSPSPAAVVEVANRCARGYLVPMTRAMKDDAGAL